MLKKYCLGSANFVQLGKKAKSEIVKKKTIPIIDVIIQLETPRKTA